MPCACDQCLQHAKTLSLDSRHLSKPALRKAFRTAAKRWHPDRFENEPAKRAEAEEHFKLVQVAYRELWEHIENPELAEPTPRPAPTPAETPEPAPQPEPPPPIFFGGAPGCYVTPRFPRSVADIIGEHLQDTERALAFVDLAHSASEPNHPRQYMLFTSYRIFVRNHMNIISLLWYTDLGEIRLIDQHKDGKPSFRQRIAETFSGIQQRFALEIFRHTGSLFYSISGQVDDSVKKVIYNFLRQMKPNSQS